MNRAWTTTMASTHSDTTIAGDARSEAHRPGAHVRTRSVRHDEDGRGGEHAVPVVARMGAEWSWPKQ
jgi:hypothetical protein